MPLNRLFPDRELRSEEDARLAALYSYDLLDSETETLFDDLVGVLRQTLDMPIAYISLVDRERQWFKAKAGLDIDETPRVISFCDHAIRSSEVMIVHDTLLDPRFADNPLVTGEPHLRFYAGAPIITPEGFAIGTICVSDREPRPGFDQGEMLAAFARQVMAIIELRRDLVRQSEAADLAFEQRDRLWDNALDMIAVAKTDGTLVAVNPAWIEHFGDIDPNGASNIVDYFSDNEDRAVSQLEDGQRNYLVDREMVDREGQILHASWSLARQGDRIYGIARDITRTKQAEAQIAHIQRMESIGELTGGIAHDFNNLLTIILGNLDIAGRRLECDDRAAASRAIGHARDGAERAANLTQRLLAFARRQTLKPDTIDPAKLLCSLAPLARQALGDRHELRLDLPEHLAPLLIDASQLENAILNLVVNARDAMAEPGSVTLSASDETVDVARLARLGSNGTSGRHVCIRVTDTGSGIEPAIAEKIFEPFFTTKQVGRGTGLGLSQVQGFVAQSGGFVTVDSKPGEGTTLSLWLPASAAGAIEAENAERIAPAETKPHCGSVLVVEDNADLRRHVCEVLEEAGWQVEQASDGQAAAEFLAEAKSLPSLVLSDVMMPRMDGNQLAAHVASEFDGVRIVLMTAYDGGNLPAKGIYADLLRKPFSPDELVGMVEKHMPVARENF